MSPDSYYLGIDGGQSSTVALIANAHGRIVGCGRGGPCNHTTGEAGRIKFFNAVSGCLSQACQQASLDPVAIEFEAVCLGFSGGASDKEAYSRELIRAKQFEITHDAAIALTGALAGEPGIIIIAGTGSMAFGRNKEGRTARAGGWGYVYGDEGGGFDIARQALRAALRMEEGWGPPTILHQALLNATGAPDANTLLHDWYKPGASRQSIAALSKLVSQAARKNDGPAASILRDAAFNLARYVQGAADNLFAGTEEVPVSHIGGVFQSEFLLDAFTNAIRSGSRLSVRAPLLNPAAGAVLTALRMAGNSALVTGAPETIK